MARLRSWRHAGGAARIALCALGAGLGWLLTASGARAHPAPFSFLDLRIEATGVRGSLIVHDFDAAHELGLERDDPLQDPEIARDHRARLEDLLGPRMGFAADGAARPVEWTGFESLPERSGLKLSFTLGARPARLDVQAAMFPYDPAHQTFVNVYEDGSLRQQGILTADVSTLRFFSGTAQGRWSALRAFVASGIAHVLGGPDHVLFLVGLLLPGGALGRLALIVTAFTVGHSISLTLAALDLFSPPARIIEPLIALTLVVLGADDLFAVRARRPAADRSTPASPFDARPLFAGCFGLVHGFGFASALGELGLPPGARTWSLASFNVGVEIGQLIVVAAAAALLVRVVRAPSVRADRLAQSCSVGIIAVGACWFVERLYATGGGA